MEHATTSERNLETYEDSILHFMGIEEIIYEDQDHGKLDINNNNNDNTGGKSLFSGLAEENLFSISHTLNYFSDQITCLLTDKGFKHAISGKSNNDPIEHLFSLNRCLGGHHLALELSTFAQEERELLFHVISKLCTNNDGSHNAISHK